MSCGRNQATCRTHILRIENQGEFCDDRFKPGQSNNNTAWNMPILKKVCRIKNDNSQRLVLPEKKSFGGIYYCRVFKDFVHFYKGECETTWVSFYPEELVTLTESEINSLETSALSLADREPQLHEPPKEVSNTLSMEK
jgi:hypothetical protein